MALYIYPAYGRHYDDEQAVKAAWEEGKDFKIFNGPYMSIRDINNLSPLQRPVVVRCWRLDKHAHPIIVAE